MVELVLFFTMAIMLVFYSSIAAGAVAEQPRIEVDPDLRREWEHRFKPHFPVFMEVARDGLVLFLTEFGRTPAKAGFYRGASTQAATNQDTERCGPHSNPDNLDTGKDHFFRIWLVEGDVGFGAYHVDFLSR